MRANLVLCALSLLGLPLACARAQGDPGAANQPGGPSRTDRFRSAAQQGTESPCGEGSRCGGPLVLELFTSQGCSSCPPADRLLSRLAKAGAVGDRQVAPLSFHVDYWNDGGWADPYSLPAWTERQRQYARTLGDDRVYTPELVVGGASGVIGSNAAAVNQAIQKADRPALLAAAAAWSKDTVTVTATAPSNADVWVAVWEDGASDKVTGGENSGETLGSDRVVRRFERVAASGQKRTTAIKLDSRWRTTGAVAFAQRSDGRITASAMLPR